MYIIRVCTHFKNALKFLDCLFCSCHNYANLPLNYHCVAPSSTSGLVSVAALLSRPCSKLMLPSPGSIAMEWLRHKTTISVAMYRLAPCLYILVEIKIFYIPHMYAWFSLHWSVLVTINHLSLHNYHH